MTIPSAFALLAATLSTDAQAADPRPAGHSVTSIEATFDRSERTQAGRVSLNMRTGDYVLTPQPDRRQDVSTVRTQRGRLARAQLDTIRAAIRTVQAEGLQTTTCRLIISNAGPIMMRLTGRTAVSTTPEELGCWSEAARGLHRALEAVFGDQIYPPRLR